MTSVLDLKAYAVRAFFQFLARLGSPLINLGATRGVEVDADQCYGSDAKQRLDIFRPKAAKRAGMPVLIYFHGGGWICADKGIYRGIAATFSKKGFVSFNVNYRLAPKSRFAETLEDATRAIDWVHRNAASYGGDPSVIVLAGDSAGAQIASWYASATSNDDLFRQIGMTGSVTKVSAKALLLFYGVYDFDTVLDARFPFIKLFARCFLGTDAQTYRINAKLASPIKQISSDLPPVWLCVGERDGLFAQSKAYADALKSHGVRCRTLFFSDAYRAKHGFLYFRWLRSSKAAIAGAMEFLRDIAKVEC